VLPEDADLRAAALLEPAACIAEACLLAALVPGERAAVVGGGTLGLLSAQLLRASSPREVVVVARRAEREPLARRMGADRLVAPGAVVPGFDVVIEAAGTPGSAQLAVDIARRGGRVVLTGIPPDRSDAVSAQTLVTQAVSVFNVFGAPSRAWVHTVRAFAAGLLDPTPLITHELPLSEIREAFRVMVEDPAVGKILLRP
jgi:threonine dehydrogenase-like Zn-dependent dehydrogenase